MSLLPEPDIELAPLRERVALWIIVAVGPWVSIYASAKWLGWM